MDGRTNIKSHFMSPEGKRPRWKTLSLMEGNITMYLQDAGWWRMEWIDLA